MLEIPLISRGSGRREPRSNKIRDEIFPKHFKQVFFGVFELYLIFPISFKLVSNDIFDRLSIPHLVFSKQFAKVVVQSSFFDSITSTPPQSPHVGGTLPESKNGKIKRAEPKEHFNEVKSLQGCEKWIPWKILHRYSDSKKIINFFFNRFFLKNEKLFF